MLRRHLVLGAIASGIVLGSGPALAATGQGGAAGAGRRRVRLGHLANPCEVITFSAPASDVFHRNDLAAQLVAFQSEAALIAALGAGTIDAASMNLPALLAPLAAGSDVRVVAGLHSGCLRVVAPEAVTMRINGSLKGATIATDRLHGASMDLLSALLRRQGVDPRHDVTWKVYGLNDAPALEAALDAKAVQSVAAADPLAYLLLADKVVEPYFDVGTGGFSCGDGIGGGHHCFLAMAGRTVERHPDVAVALTRAYLETSKVLSRGVGPDALAEAQSPFAQVDLATTIAILSSYDWNAATDLVPQELELTANDFRRAGLLARSVDPERLADRAYANVLHV